jgi:hypothetical protein
MYIGNHVWFLKVKSDLTLSKSSVINYSALLFCIFLTWAEGSRWAIVIIGRPSVVNILHFRLLLRNRQPNCFEILQGGTWAQPLPSLFKWWCHQSFSTFYVCFCEIFSRFFKKSSPERQIWFVDYGCGLFSTNINRVCYWLQEGVLLNKPISFN